MSNRARQAAEQTIAILAEWYPACFAVFEQRRKPLKIGIDCDLRAALDGAITGREMSIALRLYCGNDGYLAACREGVVRVDLGGKPAGAVSAEDAEHARKRLLDRGLKHARKKRAGRERAQEQPKPAAASPPKPKAALPQITPAARADAIERLRAAARARKAAQNEKHP